MGFFDSILDNLRFSRTPIQDIYEKQSEHLISDENSENLLSSNATQLQVIQQFQKHRIKLQEYQKKVISQKDEFNRQLDKRAADLEALENSLLEREDILKKMEENIKDRILADLLEKKENLHAQILSLKKQEIALRNTEYTIIDWISRMEKKETAVYEEILKDVEKFQKHIVVTDGYKFEEYTAELLQKNGYENVYVTQKSNDYGADILAEKDGVKYVFQCKYYTSMVGIEAVQQVYSAKDYYDAHVAVVITNNVFTKAAKSLAKELKVILWDCETINKLSEAKKAEEICQNE